MALREHELKNAYIGEEYNDPYEILSDVHVYYRMEGNLNDSGPHGWNISTVTGSYQDGGGYVTFTNFRGANTSCTYNGTISKSSGVWFLGDSFACALYLGDDRFNGRGYSVPGACVINGAWQGYSGSDYGLSTGWHFYSTSVDLSTRQMKFYRDGQFFTTVSLPSSGSIRGGTGLAYGNGNSSSGSTCSGSVGITFITNNVMPASDMLKFYNLSKSKYGL